MLHVRRIAITGASRGIGAALARRVACRGRSIALLARSEEDLEALAREARIRGARAAVIPVDLSTLQAGRLAAGAIEEAIGPPDLVVLNAGMSLDRRFLNATDRDVEHELGVNFLAPLGLMRPTLEGMCRRGRGHVVWTGSLTALVPFPGNATYAASKGAALALVRSLRPELARSGVHVGIVLPGHVRTRLTEDKHTIIPSLTPDEVARAICRCVEQRRGIVVPGLANRAAGRFGTLFPRATDRLVNVFGRSVVPGFEAA